MARSNWKLQHIATNLLKEIGEMHKIVDKIHVDELSDSKEDSIQKNATPSKIIISQRDGIIPSSMVGLTVQVYNGIKFISFKIGAGHIGKKFGEFAQTRKILVHKETKKKKLIKK